MTVIYETKPSRYIIQRATFDPSMASILIAGESAIWRNHATCSDGGEAIELADCLAAEHYPDRYRVIDTWGNE